MTCKTALALFCAAAFGCHKPNAPAAAPAPPPGAAQVLDEMDRRRPVPLLPQMALHQKENMRDHLVAVQEIAAALAVSDFSAVEKSAARIGTSDQMTRTCHHMGAGAAGFTELALSFHQTADGISEAARRKDAVGVHAALASTLATCTGCHAIYKQQVVDQAEWTKLTQQAAPAMQGH